MVRLRFSTERGSIFSALIRWGSECKVSHVEYELDDGSTLGARLSLRGKVARQFGRPHRWLLLDGVQFRPAAANVKQCGVFHATFEGIELAYQWLAANRVGVPYDLIGILGILTARGWKDSTGKFCSESIHESAIAIGRRLQNCEPQATKPRDIEISLLVTVC